MGTARTVSVARLSFDRIRADKYFYVDKTSFICDWWEAEDDVTLLCRPRRFGKTLTLSMVECFLSTRFAGRGEELFGGLDVWESDRMRALQGSVPVILVSFASCKGPTLEDSLSLILAGKALTKRVDERVDFYRLVESWFEEADESYNDFVSALLSGDARAPCGAVQSRERLCA